VLVVEGQIAGAVDDVVARLREERPLCDVAVARKVARDHHGSSDERKRESDSDTTNHTLSLAAKNVKSA